MRPYGKTNLISVALVLAVVGGIYWVVMLSPPYLDNIDIKDIVSACYNDSGRVGDDQLRYRINEVANRIGTHKAEDGFGNVTEVKGLGLKPEQITIFRDEVRRTILIKVEYDQEVQLKPLKRIKRVHFVTAKEGPVPPS